MSIIDELATQAGRLVKGINWDSLDSRSVGVPLDPQQDAHLTYWVEYLGPAFNRAADVMNTLYYDPGIVNRAATEEALAKVWAPLEAAAPQVWNEITVANLTSNVKMMLYSKFGSPLGLPAEQFRLVLSYVWGVVVFGTKLHTTFAITAMGREKWRAHGNQLVMLCEAIALLDQTGSLRELKWDSGAMVELRKQQGFSSLKPWSTPPMATSGLGMAPLVAVALGVIAAAVLMYGIYRWTSMTTEINKQTLDVTKELCTDPGYAQDAAAKDGCIKILGDALVETTKVKDPFAGPGQGPGGAPGRGAGPRTRHRRDRDPLLGIHR